MGTVWPSFTIICSRIPASKDSTSIFALSVSTSARMSPFLISSPGCFNQRVMVPSSMVSLSRGILTSDIALSPSTARGKFVDCINQLFGPGKSRQFKRLSIGQRYFEGRDTLDWGIEVVKSLFLKHGSNLCADAIGAPISFEDDGPIGLFHRVDEGFRIEGAQRTNIYDLNIQATFLLDVACDIQGDRDHI